jgi:predicted transcriptional regulator
MRLQDILTLTQADILVAGVTQPNHQNILNREVRVAFGADLMSDVLRYDVAQGLLITGLINPQIVRTAEMADASAILMVRGKKPLSETLQLAAEVNIPIIGTQMTMFETCGRLYAAGLPAAPRQDKAV